MNDLFPIVLALCALAGVFVLVLPLIWQRPIEGETVEDWLSVRRGETDDSELLSDAQLRVWDDKDGTPTASAVSVVAVRMGYQVALVCGLVTATVLLYERLGAFEDVQIARSIASLDEATADDVTALIARIEARSSDRPGNLDYQSLLGEYYVATGNASGALEKFEVILAEAPNSPDVLGRAAQAEFVAEGQVLTERAKRRAEQALTGDPRQKSALATLAMGSFGNEDYQEAIGYMRVLRDSELPGSEGYQLMSSAISEAEDRIASSGITNPESSSVASEPQLRDKRVQVTVVLPESLEPLAYAGATAFIIARPAGSEARMPTAVTRQQVSTWPLVASLSDDNSMAGQKLSALARVDIEVQISPGGQPGRANAVLIGEYAGASTDAKTEVNITLQAISQ